MVAGGGSAISPTRSPAIMTALIATVASAPLALSAMNVPVRPMALPPLRGWATRSVILTTTAPPTSQSHAVEADGRAVRDPLVVPGRWGRGSGVGRRVVDLF